MVEDFIGIVRGRTVNSTRGRSTTPGKADDKAKAKAEQKKQPRRPDAAGGRRKPPAAKKAQSAKRGKPRRRS